MTKKQLITLFRNKAEEDFASINVTNKNYKDKASEMNKAIKNYYDSLIADVLSDSSLTNTQTLESLLLTTYVSYVIMLEYRNKFWPYDYMAFARRIGELWEPFCKIPFYHPIKNLSIIEPPLFENIQRIITEEAISYIESLDLDGEEKKELKDQYEVPWSMVDSGGIQLELDLHFEQNAIHYNCDFKSGFSSNEKGNTNRLLLVASVYRYLGDAEKTLLFVRQNEDDNNHYLQTLKNSEYWDVYCASDCYEAIKNFTGYDLRAWMDANIDWENDISSDFKQHLVNNGLLKYLTW